MQLVLLLCQAFPRERAAVVSFLRAGLLVLGTGFIFLLTSGLEGQAKLSLERKDEVTKGLDISLRGLLLGQSKGGGCEPPVPGWPC